MSVTREQEADQCIDLVLDSIVRDGTPSERVLAAWLIKVRAVNDRLHAEIDGKKRKAKK